MLRIAVLGGGAVVVDVEFVLMMSGGVVDVEPSPISRNTLENGNSHSKSQRKWVKMGW